MLFERHAAELGVAGRLAVLEEAPETAEPSEYVEVLALLLEEALGGAEAEAEDEDEDEDEDEAVDAIEGGETRSLSFCRCDFCAERERERERASERERERERGAAGAE